MAVVVLGEGPRRTSIHSAELPDGTFALAPDAIPRQARGLYWTQYVALPPQGLAMALRKPLR